MLKAFATGRDLPVRSDIDVDAAYRRQRMRTIVAITLGYGLSYTCRLSIDMVKKPLIDAHIFTATNLGTIGSAFFFSYAFGKLINGFVSDHANARKFFAIGLILSALCNVYMGFSTTVLAATIAWGINGWFQSYGAPGSVVALASWFSNHERGRYYGIWSTSHSIGEGLTFFVVAAVVGWHGWQWGFWGPAIVTMMAAIAAYTVMTDRPRTMGLPAVADWRHDHLPPADPEGVAAQPQKSVFRTQLSILAIPSMWVIALSSAFIYITRYAINSWGVLYLQEARGYSVLQAGSLLTVNTLAGIVGAVAFGFISDKMFGARRPPVNLIFAVVEIIGLLLFFYGPRGFGWEVLAMILFGLGMTGLVTSVGGLFAIDMAPKRVAGAALGMVGVFSYLGAGIQDQISGVLIDAGKTTVNGVVHHDFTAAIVFWVGASLVSLILAASLWRAKLRD
ncbi:MAG: MFS transporter [Sphingomonas sp.]|uniref:MFS transporter n=1 Tax=Sphingomonas sp. TaxID=28214 RepID=UPI0012048AFA|nr:MFS transporter [Sphingomonas sp.]THD37403.1 MAG: MFS transporter [Sphingomonas sp.]